MHNIERIPRGRKIAYRGYGANGRAYRIHRDQGSGYWWATIDPRVDLAKIRRDDLTFAAPKLRDLSTKLEGLKP